VTLWFLDKGKRGGAREDTILFIDDRHLYSQIDRAHRDCRPEQIELLANIVRLHRGEGVEDFIEKLAVLYDEFRLVVSRVARHLAAFARHLTSGTPASATQTGWRESITSKPTPSSDRESTIGKSPTARMISSPL